MYKCLIAKQYLQLRRHNIDLMQQSDTKCSAQHQVPSVRTYTQKCNGQCKLEICRGYMIGTDVTQANRCVV